MPGTDSQERLGGGATIVACVFALLIGLVVGTITTFTHRQTLMLGSIAVPWGLIAGLAVVVALVAGFRLVFASRLVGGATGVGVVVASAVLALPGAGGSVLVVDGPVGYVWAIAPAVLTFVIVVWPGRRSHRAPS